MGNCFAGICRRRNVRRHIVLILIGLDNAGKTETVNNLAGEKDDRVLPTVGFKAVNLVHKDTPVTIFDLGGGPAFRQIWPQYYSEVHGVIFVIDSSDFSRLDECKVVLEEVLSHNKISGKPVLVLANKQDKQGALDDIDVVEKLNIEPLVNKYRCPTLVESYTATYPTNNGKQPKLDPGLKKGYQWLLNYIVRRYGDINLRVQTDIHADLERRKRLLNKSARASQTFTAVDSDDIATQTGFENPNYQSLSHKSSPKIDENFSNSSVIIVKPIKHVSHSLDTTVTVESMEDSDQTSAKARPKLSPLFGDESGSSTVVAEAKVELEPCHEIHKLSPIVRNKSAADQHIDFQHRPHSSPTPKSKTLPSNSSPADTFTAGDVPDACFGHAIWENTKRTVLLNDIDLQREIVFVERADNKSASWVTGAPRAPASPPAPRPASASHALRRQLEQAHRRRFSAGFKLYHNKTSPEAAAAGPRPPARRAPAKLPRRRLDTGDFEREATYLSQRDVGM